MLPVPANQTRWMAQRAILAILLMIAFYALALAIAGALLWVPYAQFTVNGRTIGRLTLWCVIGAGTIIWSIIPRPDRFEPPGPELLERDEPKLFGLIGDVAGELHQERPVHVYLVPDVNAFVTHRGGFMGFGSKRVMGIGLPLLQTLSVAELKAVIAHEFGHYAAGDVKIGPWIYKTRAGIGRTITAFGDGVLHYPFLWFGKLFLRLTHAVSRRQEFMADEIAARSAGAGAAASALRSLAALDPMYSSFLQQEFSPVVRAGFLPPLTSGLHQFLNQDDMKKTAASILTATEETVQTNAFDTHPALADRVTALRNLPQTEAAPDSPPAGSLVSDLNTLSRRIVEQWIGEENAGTLKAIEWDGVAEAVHMPVFRGIVQGNADAFRGLTSDGFADARATLRAIGERFHGSADGVSVEDDEKIRRGTLAFGAALAVALSDHGWTAVNVFGGAIQLRSGEHSLAPVTIAQALASGVLTVEAWKAQCATLGISHMPLASDQQSRTASV